MKHLTRALQLFIVACMFYLLGLNTHNAVWKWMDDSKPVTMIEKVAIPDSCLVTPNCIADTAGEYRFIGPLRFPEVSDAILPGKPKRKSLKVNPAAKRSYEFGGVYLHDSSNGPFLIDTNITGGAMFWGPSGKIEYVTSDYMDSTERKQYDIEDRIHDSLEKRRTIIQNQ